MNDIAPLDLTRSELVEVNAPALKELVLKHHKPEEAIAKLDYLKRLLDEVDKSIRQDLVKTMDGSYDLDAYNRYTISRTKMPAKWEFIHNQKHVNLKAEFERARKRLKDYEDEMKACGMAVDQNENQYTITLRERKS